MIAALLPHLPPFASLPGLLPLATLALAIARLRRRPGTGGWTDAIVGGSAAWGAGIVAVSETLGALGALHRTVLLPLWSTAFLLLSASFLLPRRALPSPTCAAAPSRGCAKRGCAKCAAALSPLFAATAATALLVPPNTWDTLCYHLSRVEFWLQQGSLAFYPTSVARQLFSQPFAELAVLHIHALAGGDWLDGLVQWSAHLGCVALVHGLARRLSGGSRRAAAAAAVFAGTLPIALAEASTCQNDLVVSFWLLAALHALVRLGDAAGWPAGGGARLGATAGLAVLTKGSAYPLLLPVAALAAARTLRAPRRRLPAALVALGVALALNAPHWTRTTRAFGDPFGGQAASFRPPATAPALAATAWCNAASDLFPLAPGATVAATRRVLAALRIEPGDRAVFWPGCDPLRLPGTAFHHDTAPNPLHALLLLAAVPAALLRRRDAPAAALWLAASFAFLLCVRWQLWITRLQTPLLLAGAVPAGLAAARLPRNAVRAAAALLLVAALPIAFASADRSLVSAPWTNRCNWRTSPREHLYFAARRSQLLPTASACDRIAALRPDALALSGDAGSWDYPLFPMLRARMAGGLPVIRYAAAPDAGPLVLRLSSTDRPRLVERPAP